MHTLFRLRLLCPLLALPLCAASLPAAQTPYVATIAAIEAEVRCKPSTKPELYPTNHLHQGTRVLVLEERTDGWLAIQPPEDSLSWVNLKQVQRIVQTQNNWVVASDNVPVLIGSRLVNQRPTVEGLRLARGTQVHSIAAPLLDGDTQWLPIDPPAGEVRYILARDVAPAANQTPPAPAPVADPARTPTPVIAVSRTPTPTPATPSLSIPNATGPTPALPANADPWEKGRWLITQRRYDEAIQQFEYLAKVSRQRGTPKDLEWADYSMKMAIYARQEKANAGTTNDPRSTSTFQPASRLSSPAPQQQPLPDVRLSGPVDPTAPAPAPTTTQTNWSSPPAATTETHKTSVGTLVKAGMPINNQPAYTLKTNDGSRWYVQAGPGVDLESLVDRDVECYGKAVYWGDWRANYMVVSRVQAR
jgi:hypothetical protein